MPCWILKLLSLVVSEKIKIGYLHNALRGRREAHLSPFLGGQWAKMSISLQQRKCSSWITVSNTVNSWTVEPLSRNRDPTMTQNEYVYAIYYRPEVAGDVISS